MVALAQLPAKPGAAGGRLPRIQLLVERGPADGLHARVEQPGAPQVQHHFRDGARHEDLHGRVIAGTVRQRIDEPGHPAVDGRPIARVGPAQSGGVSNGGDVQDQVRRSAERRVDDHGVAKRGVGHDVAHRDVAPFHVHQGARGPARHVEPDRMAGRGQRRVAERHPERFTDDLRRRGGAEELATASGRCAGAAPDVGRLGQIDLAVRESHADRLHAAGVLPFERQQRDAARDQDARQVVARGERHHHRRQSLVARRDAQHAAPRRQRSDETPENRRRVVAEGETVEHRGRSLRAPVARVGARRRERDRPRLLERLRGRLHQQADLPMAGVIAEGDGRAVRRANAAVRREDQELLARQRRRVPSHPGVLAPPEQIAGRPISKHVFRQRERARRARGPRHDIQQAGLVGIEWIGAHPGHSLSRRAESPDLMCSSFASFAVRDPSTHCSA